MLFSIPRFTNIQDTLQTKVLYHQLLFYQLNQRLQLIKTLSEN